MTVGDFRESLLAHFDEFQHTLSTDTGDWVVKGFIGFTLGAFTGYFRQRKSAKNITFPYEQYAAHFVLGTIYSRRDEAIDERRVYQLDDLQDIVSVVKDFTFDMARAIDSDVSYRNLEEYWKWRGRAARRRARHSKKQ